jgi:hypothetical protein
MEDINLAGDINNVEDINLPGDNLMFWHSLPPEKPFSISSTVKTCCWLWKWTRGRGRESEKSIQVCGPSPAVQYQIILKKSEVQAKTGGESVCKT